VALDPGCESTAADRGLAVVSCTQIRGYGQTTTTPSIYRISTREFLPIPGGDDVAVVGWYAIGRQWIEGSEDCYHCGAVYRNWHTGEEFSTFDDDVDCYDLDRPQQPVPCPGEGEIAREDGYTLKITGRFNGVAAHPLVLEHGRKTVRVSRCKAVCSMPMLSGGYVYWIEGTTVHGYAARSRKRATWNPPHPVRAGLGLALTPLAADVVLTVRDGGSGTTHPVAAPDVWHLSWPK
jgi:hypothetical protein